MQQLSANIGRFVFACADILSTGQCAAWRAQIPTLDTICGLSCGSPLAVQGAQRLLMPLHGGTLYARALLLPLYGRGLQEEVEDQSTKKSFGGSGFCWIFAPDLTESLRRAVFAQIGAARPPVKHAPPCASQSWLLAFNETDGNLIGCFQRFRDRSGAWGRAAAPPPPPLTSTRPGRP